MWAGVPVQRCTVHKHRNLLAQVPERLHEEIGADSGNTTLHFDTNGNTGKEAMTIILTGTGLGLTVSDFQLCLARGSGPFGLLGQQRGGR